MLRNRWRAGCQEENHRDDRSCMESWLHVPTFQELAPEKTLTVRIRAHPAFRQRGNNGDWRASLGWLKTHSSHSCVRAPSKTRWSVG